MGRFQLFTSSRIPWTQSQRNPKEESGVAASSSYSGAPARDEADYRHQHEYDNSELEEQHNGFIFRGNFFAFDDGDQRRYLVLRHCGSHFLVFRICNIKALPDANRLLKHLSGHGVPMALVSNSPRASIESKISHHQGWKESFCAIIGGDEVTTGKPSPEIFLEAAKKLNMEPSSYLVIEDSVPGVLAGKAAQMEVVAVPSVPKQTQLFSAADEIIKSLLDLRPEKWGLPAFEDFEFSDQFFLILRLFTMVMVMVKLKVYEVAYEVLRTLGQKKVQNLHGTSNGGIYWQRIAAKRDKKPYTIMLEDKNAPNEEV